LESNIDLFILIDGFNNLGRPLENYAFQLPLNYPGESWIACNFLGIKKTEGFYIGNLFALIRDKPVIKKSKVFFLLSNSAARLFLKKYYTGLREKIIENVSKIDDKKKMQILKQSTKFYKEDVTEIALLAKKNNIKTMFILQPILGYLKDELAKEEKRVLEEKKQYDLRLAPVEVWIQGYKELKKRIGELNEAGIDALDFSDIFKDNKEDTFADLMHMNDRGQDIFAEKLAQAILSRIRND